MAKLANLARMTVSSAPGTATTIPLGAACTNYLTFAGAGINNGDVVTYAADDSSGYEIGTATYSASGPQLTGRTVLNSSAGTTALSLTANAQIFVTSSAADVAISDGGCRLVYTSASAITLTPMNGNTLIINGIPQTVTSPTLAPTGLTGYTTYFVYAWMNSGVMTLEASTTGHTLDAFGRQNKTGDTTRRLVGMCFTDGTSMSSPASYFNRHRSYGSIGVTAATASSNYVAVSSSFYLLNWADEPVRMILTGKAYTSGGPAVTYIFSCCGIDNGTIGNQTYSCYGAPWGAISIECIASPAEGLHTYQAFGAQYNGGTANFAGSYYAETMA